MSTSSAPSLLPTPLAPPVPPAHRSRRSLYIVVAIVAVVAVLLAVYVVSPTLTKSSSAGGPAVLTYSGAVPIANRTAAGYAGGGWTLLFAIGLDSAANETFPANATALGNITQYCTYTQVADISALVLPEFLGNRSAGAAPAWEFAYRNSAGTIAIASVIDGQGTVLATLSGLECAFLAQVVSPVPANVIDSSRAAAAVEAKAADFLTQHPNASAEFGLVGSFSYPGGHTYPAEWSIAYSTCPLSPTATGTGAEFNATVNALTGQVLGWNTTSGVSCGGGLASATPIHGSPPTGQVSERPLARARPGA